VNLKKCETQVSARLTLVDGTLIRIASAELSFAEEDSSIYTYEAKITSDAELNAAITKSADGTSLEATNVDKEIGLTINESITSLLGAKVTFCKVFRPDTGGTWENKVLLQGEIANAVINETVVKLTIVSDTSPNLAFISTRPIQAACPLVFKGKACGYTGSLTTCDHLYDSDAGCAGRNNQHRYGGVANKGDLAEIVPVGITGFNDGDGRLPTDRREYWYGERTNLP
jgi:hypothetical protein